MSDDNGAPGKARDKAELVERIDTEWRRLEDAIAHLDDRQMSVPGEGGWTIKDNLAHITFWEQFMLARHLDGRPGYQAAGVDEQTYKGLNETTLNDLNFRRHRDRPASAILADLRRSHQQVMDRIEATPWEELTRPNAFDPNRQPILLWVAGNTYEHYLEHRETIEKLAKEGEEG